MLKVMDRESPLFPSVLLPGTRAGQLDGLAGGKKIL